MKMSTTRHAVAFAFAFSSASGAALADIAPPTPASPSPTPTPAEAPPAPPEPAKDPVLEPRALVESGPNNVATLQKAIGLYETILADAARPAKERADGYADLSRAYLRLGDIKTSDKDKLDAYEKGQAAGKKAVEIAGGKHTDGLFWATANLATTGRTKGVMNSLFMIGDLRKGMNTVLAQNPNYHLARNTLGEIDHAVPGFAGGSDERAEKAYLEVLKRDPHFTASMNLMARLKKDQGKKDEARMWAQKVLDEKAPSMRNDWRKFDVRDAKAILADLK
jgi:tetratricopeptide (TPR) repeat protein